MPAKPEVGGQGLNERQIIGADAGPVNGFHWYFRPRGSIPTLMTKWFYEA